MAPAVMSREAALENEPKKGTYQIVLANPYLFGVALVCPLLSQPFQELFIDRNLISFPLLVVSYLDMTKELSPAF